MKENILGFHNLISDRSVWQMTWILHGWIVGGLLIAIILGGLFSGTFYHIFMITLLCVWAPILWYFNVMWGSQVNKEIRENSNHIGITRLAVCLLVIAWTFLVIRNPLW